MRKRLILRNGEKEIDRQRGKRERYSFREKKGTQSGSDGKKHKEKQRD